MKKEIKLYAIKDQDGKYVDRDSIWFDKKVGKWIYNCHDTHSSPCQVTHTLEEAKRTKDKIIKDTELAGLHKSYEIEEFVW